LRGQFDLQRLERREEELHGQLAAHATDHVALAGLDTELRAVQDERTGVERALLTLAEQVPDA
jgi:ABC transport system ATP-binding/permease protein